jgi:hypothetical protein
MNPYIEAVIELANVPNPIERPTKSDWCVVEEQLRIVLPEDYKIIVSTLGNGRFGGLALRNPVDRFSQNNFDRIEYTLWHSEMSQKVIRDNLHLYPAPGGFLHVGMTGFGCELFVHCASGEADAYEICWYDLDMGLSRIMHMSICQFLHDLYLKKLCYDWAEEERAMVWENNAPFFVGGADLVKGGSSESLNY